MSPASQFIRNVFVLVCYLSLILAEFVNDKICIGTNGRMSVPSNRDHHFRNLRDRYTNCTYVDGNLELTWLQDEKLDLSFLKYIREVTGYVLISHVDVKHIVLPSLQIIRGRTLFKLSVSDDSFALFVMLSKMHTLEMPALRDILQGSVNLFNNYNLCHIRSINWTEIMSDSSSKYFYTYNFTQPQRNCHCHKHCDRGCWGKGKNNCQKFSKITCSPQCHDGRCYGPGPRDCCHLFCAGGCTGPTQSDCLACHNFNDDGECKQDCPPMKRYNTITYSWETNPDGKYAYGATCVRECPGHLLKDSGACVRSCPSRKKAVNGECVPCVGPCPKTCRGYDNVHFGNIDSFAGCTVIDGSLTILDHSFDGFQFVYKNFTFGDKYPAMHPSKLEVFHTLKEVTGYISIQASHPEFTNLSFLRNLETIGGRETTEYFSSLYIVKTSLKSLGLRSLKNIRSGSIYILENSKLCFADSINWRRIMDDDGSKSTVLLQNNQDDNVCRRDSLVCHSECSDNGCWDVQDDQCLSCKHHKLHNRCVNNCSMPGIYQVNSKECSFCHPECEGGCYGEESNHCVKCKHVKDGPYCVPECPHSKYDDHGACQVCHPNCVNGCTGPENNIGSKGCNACQKVLVNQNDQFEYCIRNDEHCPYGYFSDLWVSKDPASLSTTVCRKCHSSCKNCTAYGIHTSVCHECKQYRRGENCEEMCPDDHFVDEKLQECFKCSSECSDGCVGPLTTDCKGCRNYRIYYAGEPDLNNTKFNCTATCPPEYPHKQFPHDFSDPFCSKEMAASLLSGLSMPAIVAGSIGCIFIVFIFLFVICYLWWQRNRNKEEALKMTMNMMPYDDNEPLKPTNIKPNLAKLRIVKEAELRKGGILGYGAFGTVYKGVWVPEGENVKIPVAIKVLRDGTGVNLNKEILEEAYIMASVDHPNLLQLLAVCMTTQIMLVTQLMPLGCLLDYVRNNKEKIGSKPLLNWCTQIAKGMHYLEDRRLVHRDLAARNVLVQTPNSVKITDFGLAKLLDYNEEEYKAAGGKMPIKWLALECIQHRIFTHKSDVWAFGVTIWEVLTYGGRPYEDIPAREVPDLLEKGERLPQPSICTIDVYMLMIRCWMLDAESRPSFRELSEEFAKMSRDPGRFLVIQGDKLMRLPSYTPQDERELIRSLSSAIGGEEVLMAAEEYLQPKCNDSILEENQNSIKSVPNSIIANMKDGSKFERSLPANQSRGNHLGRFDFPANLDFQSNVDSLKIFDTEMGDDDCFEADAGSNPASHGERSRQDGVCRSGYGWVGNMRLDLPLDDDDYLMPSPQTNGVPTLGPSHQNYVDLLTEQAAGRKYCTGRRNGEHSNPASVYPQSYDHNPGVNFCVAMDNPEYHLTSQSTRHRHHYPFRINHQPGPQNIGIPVPGPVRQSKPSVSSCTSSHSSGRHGSANHKMGPVSPTSCAARIRQNHESTSSEYYNDISATSMSGTETTV